MSDSSPNVFVIAVIAGIVIIGGYFILRGTPDPSDTILPVAIAGSNVVVETGESFTLDGSESTDNIGIVSYTWQLGSDSENGELATFTIENPGIYFATLIVRDEAGNVGQDSTQITVNAQAEMEPTPDPEPTPEPIPEPEPTPEPEPEPEPEVSPAIDGVIEEDEYMHTTESSIGVTVYWTNTDENIFVALESPGSGWVAIGFDPGTAMSGANFIFGYVTSSGAFARDEYGVALFSHGPDISNGGTDDIIDFAAIESEGTVFEFSIPLDSGDSTDKPLTPGSSYTCRIAYSNTDNFTTKHAKKGSISITLD